MRKRSNMSLEVSQKIREAGFDAAFAELVGNELNTDFTARMMLGYLRDAHPVKEEQIADEMLGILELRDRCQKKILERKKHIMRNSVFLKKIELSWTARIEESYVGEIESIRNLDGLELNSPVTLFTGENGTGKSTLLEAIAVKAGLCAEGGTMNYCFETCDTTSCLSEGLKLIYGSERPRWKYFLRAETFYNVATVTQARYNDGGGLPDYHAMSHGESFLEFIERSADRCLFLLDEPEAALSPKNQLRLLKRIVQQTQKGAQFIIATHSPILLGIPGGEIFSFDEGYIHPVRYEQTDVFQTLRMFLENRELVLKQLLEDDQEESDEGI